MAGSNSYRYLELTQCNVLITMNGKENDLRERSPVISEGVKPLTLIDKNEPKYASASGLTCTKYYFYFAAG